MTEEARQSILAGLDADSEQGEKIGLANVHMRLKLVFGERYHLIVRSREGQGTEITVRLDSV